MRQGSRRQRGSVLLVVMVVLASLLAGGGVALYLQLGSTRQAGLVRFSRAALYCAEAGLQATRRLLLCNYGPTENWRTLLDPLAGAPDWYPAVPTDVAARMGPGAPSHGIVGDAGEGDGGQDWVVWVEDDEDELTGTPNSLVDDNFRILVHSRCIMFEDQPREVMEMLRGSPSSTQYQDKRKGQQGVSDQTSNVSDPCL